MSTPGEQLSEEPSIPCPNVTDLICWGTFVFVILNVIWRRRGCHGRTVGAARNGVSPDTALCAVGRPEH
jgi:hypothetical protein